MKSNFKSMNQTLQKEIASKGGIAAHELGRAHEWNSEEARIAGKKSAAANKKKRELK